MNDHGLTPENLLRTLPEVLRNDENMMSIASSIAQALSARPEELLELMIYPRIDHLPDALLDILAQDFKVDWWDPDYTLAEKRQTLKDSWAVHRILGTKEAMKRAISAIFEDIDILEWFEYGGEPYRFKLRIHSRYEEMDPVKYQRVLDRVHYYKNLRSHLDGIVHPVEVSGAAALYCGAKTGCVHIKIKTEVPPYGME